MTTIFIITIILIIPIIDTINTIFYTYTGNLYTRKDKIKRIISKIFYIIQIIGLLLIAATILKN